MRIEKQMWEEILNTYTSYLFTRKNSVVWDKHCKEENVVHYKGKDDLIKLFTGSTPRENRTGTTDWFQIGKGVCQGWILSHCLFNFYAEYIMRNAGLEKAQAGIRIAGRNNLRYADDTTLMAESEEELKSLLMKVKKSEKVGLKHNIQKTKIIASGSITSWQIDGETGNSGWLYFFGSKITADGDWSHEIKTLTP